MLRPIPIGKFRGIPMEVRPSAFILLGLIIVLTTFAEGTIYGLPVGFGGLDIPFLARLGLGVLCAGIIFLGIILHEIAHSAAARWEGHRVENITVVYFGGEANIVGMRPHEHIKGEELIAFMGPASNLAMGFLFWGASLGLGSTSDTGMEVLITVLSVLGFYNILLGLFNLLPGYPFDGGLMLRSFLRRRMDQEKTLMTAVKVCRVCAIGIGVIGVLDLNILVLIIAVLLYMTAYVECPEFIYKVE